MTLRRLHVPDLPAAGDVVVAGDEAHHLVRVLRAVPGLVVALFDGRGREVAAEVVWVAGGRACLRIRAERTPRRPGRDVLLCTAIPRGQRMEWLVEKCTEVGVGRVLPILTARGVRDRVSPNVLRRWQRAAVEAAKQCGRGDVPAVAAPCTLENALSACAERTLLLADPAADAPLAASLPEDGGVAFVIGPEGGFDAAETATLRVAGARPFCLGPLVLRVETAAVVAVHTAARG